MNLIKLGTSIYLTTVIIKFIQMLQEVYVKK